MSTGFRPIQARVTPSPRSQTTPSISRKTHDRSRGRSDRVLGWWCDGATEACVPNLSSAICNLSFVLLHLSHMILLRSALPAPHPPFPTLYTYEEPNHQGGFGPLVRSGSVRYPGASRGHHLR